MVDPLAALRRPFSAVIFDCDGTLADTMDLHYRAWADTLAPHGLQFPEPLFYALGGVPTPGIVDYLNRQFGWNLPVLETTEQKEAEFARLLPGARPVLPVTALVQRYRGRMPLAVASGGPRLLVERTLHGLNLRHCFQVVSAAEDVNRGKPNPDLFLMTARRLRMNPADCVVFEDSRLGLEAAARAGMQAVDVSPWLSPPPHKGAHAAAPV